MGILDRLAQLLRLKKKEANIIVVGLDNSGEFVYYHLLTANHDEAYHLPDFILCYVHHQCIHLWASMK